jgi:thiamine pyrophosphate-dependent acetolactate synthase large subunit-like protein
MGAYMAQNERPVISVSGDGGFAQYMGEFNTAVHYKMNIKHIMLNNNELGKISREQIAEKFPIWQTRLTNPNFADYARQCGGMGIRVESEDKLEHALKQAFEYEGPAIVEVITDADLI